MFWVFAVGQLQEAELSHLHLSRAKEALYRPVLLRLWLSEH